LSSVALRWTACGTPFVMALRTGVALVHLRAERPRDQGEVAALVLRGEGGAARREPPDAAEGAAPRAVSQQRERAPHRRGEGAGERDVEAAAERGRAGDAQLSVPLLVREVLSVTEPRVLRVAPEAMVTPPEAEMLPARVALPPKLTEPAPLTLELLDRV